MGELYILCGPSGAGKSMFGHLLSTQGEACLIVSRDNIRFSLVKEDEEYFCKEKIVFDTFVKTIQKAIDENIPIVVADATHLNEKSRNKLLNRLDCKKYNIIAVNFLAPLNVCLERNEFRKGTRAYVPRGVIRRQKAMFVLATYNEKFKYNKIINI